MLTSTFRGLGEMQARIQGALDAGPYLLGDPFSAADILLVSLAQFSRATFPAGPRADDYLKRIGARPALKRALKRDATG